MRPERITTESPIAESSPADQRTEGSYQRMVGLLAKRKYASLAAILTAMAYATPQDNPAGATMCAAAMCALLLDYETCKQSND